MRAVPPLALEAASPAALALVAATNPALQTPSVVPGRGLDQLRSSLVARNAPQAFELVERLHFTDTLTGLPNRAYFIEHGARALQGRNEPAAAMLDMDNFRAVNGGLVGIHGVMKGRARADAVLALAGAVLRELARRHDVTAFRLGGEEFALLGSMEGILAFCADAQAMMPSERLLSAAGLEPRELDAISQARIRSGRDGQPIGDFSYGVALLLDRDPAAALHAADQALNAAKADGRRGSVRITASGGAGVEWTPPARPGPPPPLPTATTPRTTAPERAALEALLNSHELSLFEELYLRDPLTFARSGEYVAQHVAQWDRDYVGGGVVALISARNLKLINDVLGHEAGDRYLRYLGLIIRHEVSRARHMGLDVREVVRISSKEFLFVGRNAETVARRVRWAVVDRFDNGHMLRPSEVAGLRYTAVRKGLVPEGRERLIGGIRIVAEPIRADSGFMRAVDDGFERLHKQKLNDAVWPSERMELTTSSPRP